LRFDERNIHAQRKYCNKYKAGNQAAMRLGVIERIGLSEVMALENDNEPHKWTHQELDEKEQYFKAKLKELKRERGE
jgi:selenocysteine-specific translation elongation factor